MVFPILIRNFLMTTSKAVSAFSHDADDLIAIALPFSVSVTLEGTSDLLFHRWSPEAIDAKARAAKNSAAKKTDDIESYVYRNQDNELCIPGEYLRQAVITAAKFKQDPRSPRKSAMDLYKAGVVTLSHLASTGKTQWDYEDRRRVVIQRSGVNRVRPALTVGWRAEFQLMVLLPEYISPMDLREMIEMSGRLIGIADFRPTFGRFGVVNFEVMTR
jgi:hypothetical protein